MQQAEALALMSRGLGAQLRPPRTVDRPVSVYLPFYQLHIIKNGFDIQPPLYGCNASPMNGAGQPLASTFPRFPSSAVRSLFVAILNGYRSLNSVVV